MQEVLFRFPRRHSCPPAGKSELGGEFLRRRDPAASTSPHLKWLLSSPVTFPPGRLTDCIRSPNHIKDIYKRRQREKKCAGVRHVSLEHFGETYFARLHLGVAAHRSVGNLLLLPLLLASSLNLTNTDLHFSVFHECICRIKI